MSDTSRWRRALTGRIDYRRLARVLAERVHRLDEARDGGLPGRRRAGGGVSAAGDARRAAAGGVFRWRFERGLHDGDSGTRAFVTLEHGRTLQVRVFPQHRPQLDARRQPARALRSGRRWSAELRRDADDERRYRRSRPLSARTAARRRRRTPTSRSACAASASSSSSAARSARPCGARLTAATSRRFAACRAR